jgi:hypothetical protein
MKKVSPKDSCPHWKPFIPNFNTALAKMYKEWLDIDTETNEDIGEYVIFYKRHLQNILSQEQLDQLNELLMKIAFPKIKKKISENKEPLYMMKK